MLRRQCLMLLGIVFSPIFGLGVSIMIPVGSSPRRKSSRMRLYSSGASIYGACTRCDGESMWTDVEPGRGESCDAMKATVSQCTELSHSALVHSSQT